MVYIHLPKLVYSALASATIGLVGPLYCSALRHMRAMSDNTAWTVVYWKVAIYIEYVYSIYNRYVVSIVYRMVI